MRGLAVGIPLSLVLWILIITGCNSVFSPKDPGPRPPKRLVWLEFDTSDCPQGATACVIYGPIDRVLLPWPGWQGCIVHETDHVLYGAWHSDDVAVPCKTNRSSY